MKAKIFTGSICVGGALFLYMWMGHNVPNADVPVANYPIREVISLIFFMVFGFIGLSLATYKLIKWFL